MLYKMLDADFRHIDERGSLVQLVHEGYKQVNVIISKGGIVRGGHYHKLNFEAFYVVNGSFEVTFLKNGVEEKSIFHTGDFFEIEPYTGHIFTYLQDTVLIGLYNVGVEKENGEKDIFPVETE